MEYILRKMPLQLLLLLILFLLHLHASSYPSKNLLVSAHNQYQENVRDKGAVVSIKAGNIEGVTSVDRYGGGGGHSGSGGGGGGGGHSSERGSRGKPGRTCDKVRVYGNVAAMPLYEASADAQNDNCHHQNGKNSGTVNCIGLSFLACAILVSVLLVLKPI